MDLFRLYVKAEMILLPFIFQAKIIAKDILEVLVQNFMKLKSQGLIRKTQKDYLPASFYGGCSLLC